MANPFELFRMPIGAPSLPFVLYGFSSGKHVQKLARTLKLELALAPANKRFRRVS